MSMENAGKPAIRTPEMAQQFVCHVHGNKTFLNRMSLPVVSKIHMLLNLLIIVLSAFIFKNGILHNLHTLNTICICLWVFLFFFNSKLFIHEFHYMYVVGIKKILYEKRTLVSFMHIFIYFISNDIGKLILLYFYTSDAITVDI